MPHTRKGLTFWLIFLSICISPSSPPRAHHRLHRPPHHRLLPPPLRLGVRLGRNWYSLASTAFLPLSGGLAEIFGRQHALLLSIGLFRQGARCVALDGRANEDTGRGALPCVVGPVIGGGLAAQGPGGDLNLPIAGLAAVFVVLFLRLPTPPGTFGQKIRRLDLGGNLLIIASTTCLLVPLWCGLLGLAFFLLYEATVAVDPLLASSPLCVVYFLPVYFQACHSASALRSAVLGLGVAALAPAAIVAGVLVSKTGRYRPQMWTGWGISMIGLGLLSTVRRATPVWQTVLWGGVLGGRIGPPLPVSQNARALAFLTFVGSFAGVWGLTIGGTVLDNQLLRRLPDSFTAHFAPPEGSSTLAYALIPRIPALPLLLRLEVQDAFAEALSVVWLVLAAIAGLGLLASLFMKGLPLHTKLDERWGLVEMDVRDSRDGRRAGRSRAPVLRFEMVSVPGTVVKVDFPVREMGSEEKV
ncbi:putative transporter C3H1.06c [Mycena venus]|uniref:Putative transporter C3H1.06c n=1 Tax=Mycena venus TaxID=2733690 RepID=A0A8H6U057_9AGAR|nr:putative transporter C3H1.06c [Mycena venus]